MIAIAEWWRELGGSNQAFYVAAGFFSLIFVWQFISALLGLSDGGADVDAGVDMDVDADIEAGSPDGAADTIAAFKVLSLRAVLAFLTMFFWAAALYLDMLDKTMLWALAYATAWGLGGWLVVTLLVNWLARLAEVGTMRFSSCVGHAGTVYMDIPADGEGKVRVPVSGAITMVSARMAGGAEAKGGTPVRVVRMLDHNTAEVKPVGKDNEGKETEQ